MKKMLYRERATNLMANWQSSVHKEKLVCTRDDYEKGSKGFRPKLSVSLLFNLHQWGIRERGMPQEIRIHVLLTYFLAIFVLLP